MAAVLWAGGADAQTTTTENTLVTTTTAAADPLATAPESLPATGGGLMAGASAGAGFLALASVTRRFLRQ